MCQLKTSFLLTGSETLDHSTPFLWPFDKKVGVLWVELCQYSGLHGVCKNAYFSSYIRRQDVALFVLMSGKGCFLHLL